MARVVAECRVAQVGVWGPTERAGVDRRVQGPTVLAKGGEGQDVVAWGPGGNHAAEVQVQGRVPRRAEAVGEGKAAAGGPILPEAQPRLGDAVRELGEERCDPSIELLDVWVQAGVVGKEETAGEHAPGREGVGGGELLARGSRWG